MKIWRNLLVLLVLSPFYSCNKKEEMPGKKFGNVELTLEHTIDNQPLRTNIFDYLNKSGNVYMVSDVQWFISNMHFVKDDGSVVYPDSAQIFLYIDTELTSSLKQRIELLPVGHYRKIGFTFGLDENANQSYKFVNPPQSYMFWPEYLGGGYHYLKLNGKWINSFGDEQPFNFHLGIGQNTTKNSALNSSCFTFGIAADYDHCEGFTPPLVLPEVVSFVQNYFDVNQEFEFVVEEGQTTNISLEMQIDQWFDGIIPYNHNEWGGSIMQKQEAQEVARTNGTYVFRLHGQQ